MKRAVTVPYRKFEDFPRGIPFLEAFETSAESRSELVVPRHPRLRVSLENFALRLMKKKKKKYVGLFVLRSRHSRGSFREMIYFFLFLSFFIETPAR